MQFLFSPDSFGDMIEVDDERDSQDQPGTGARVVTTPKIRQYCERDGTIAEAPMVEDYESKAETESQGQLEKQQNGAKPIIRSFPNFEEDLVIIEDWEPENCKQLRHAGEETPALTKDAANTLEESIEQLFGSSPFFSLMDHVKRPIDSNGDGNDDQTDNSKTNDDEQLQHRNVQDDWSFLCIEMAVCRRRRSRNREDDHEDMETMRFMEQTRTFERLMNKTRDQSEDEATENEQTDQETDVNEERERQRRVMSRLHEAEEWVNELDGESQRKKRRKWRVTNLESYILATGKITDSTA